MRLGFYIILTSFFIFISCRGTNMKDPPIHILPNMDDQGRVDDQDGFRELPEGVEASDGTLMDEEAEKYSILKKTGFDDKNYIDQIPDGYYTANKEFVEGYTVDQKFIERGRNRYDIYCAPCHGISGNGKGAVTNDKFSWNAVDPVNLQELLNWEDLENVEEYNFDMHKDGYLFHVISNGKGSMKGYSHQISVDDRWKIVAYLRVLSHAKTEKYPNPNKGNAE